MIERTPGPAVYIGTISGNTTIPIIRVGKIPHIIKNISIWVDTTNRGDSDNYWKVAVKKQRRGDGSPHWSSSPFFNSGEGFKANTWRELLTSTGMMQNETLLLVFTKTGTATNISGLCFTYQLKVREVN